MIDEFFRMGIKSVKKRKIRSWLTMIGIFIGVSAVVSMLSLGQGLQDYIDEQFESLGRDILIIQPAGVFAPPGSSASDITLTLKDVRTIERTRGIEEASYWSIRPGEIEFKDQTRYFFISGVPLEETKKSTDLLSDYDIIEGRILKKGDNFKVNLGISYLEGDLFSPNLKLRDKIEINGFEVEVVGFYESFGNSEDDQNVILPHKTMKEIFNLEDDVDFITAKASLGANPENVKERVEEELRKSRNVKEDKEDFSVQTAEDLLESFGTILIIMQAFLIGIASISLIVGGIGIMNTMYTSVLERTREIGIMKSVGARNSDILTIFLIESGILGFVGGLMGVLLGMGLSKLVVYVAAVSGQSFISASFPGYLIIGTLLFSFIIGAISGVLPAIQASKLKPVDALRYE